MGKSRSLRRGYGLVVCALLLGAVGGCERAASPPVPATAPTGAIAVYFSPKGGCTEAIVRAIDGAGKSLDVQAYSFTSVPVAEAVVRAHKRGVKVRVVLDKSQRGERYTSATFLVNHQVPVWIDDQHGIAHNKIMIIDGSTILTGSFNFSKAAEEHNAENLLVIQGYAELAAKYAENFRAHLGHSTVYEGR